MVILGAVGIRFGPTLVELLKEPEELIKTIESYGQWGILVFIGIQFIQIVLPPIPGRVVQIAGGYIFGLWQGILFLLVGSALGSLTAFYAARLFGAPLVATLVPEDKQQRLAEVMKRRKTDLIVFVAFLIPAFPKDLLTYVAGLTSISGPRFVFLGLAGRLPGLLMSVFVGASLRGGSYESVIIVACAMLGFLFLSFWKRKWIGEQLQLGNR